MPILPVYTKHIHPTWVCLCYALLHPTSTGLSYKPDCATLSSWLYFFISRPLPFLLTSVFRYPPSPKPHFDPAGCILPSSASSAYILTELTGTEAFLLVPLMEFRPCCCETHSVHVFFFKHLPQFSVPNSPHSFIIALPCPVALTVSSTGADLACCQPRDRWAFHEQECPVWLEKTCLLARHEASRGLWGWLHFGHLMFLNILYVFRAFSSKRACISTVAGNGN